jgi:hypothetical protein
VNALRIDHVKLLVLVALAILSAVSGGGFFDDTIIFH